MSLEHEEKPVLEVVGLGVAYAGKPALADVSLRFPQHQVSALIGPSGCGKTSFLYCLNRLTDMTPGCRVSGQILLKGQDISAMEVMTLRCQVGMIFQKPNPFPLSVRRNIELPLREHGMKDRRLLAETVERVFRQTGLWHEVRDRLDSPALLLSGGQQQRLCIARALALQPGVLLMDEPCSALDPLSAEIIENLILDLKGRYSVVIVTHNLPQARRIADQAAFFWHTEGVGRLIEWGPASNMFDSPQHPLTQNYVSGRTG